MRSECRTATFGGKTSSQRLPNDGRTDAIREGAASKPGFVHEEGQVCLLGWNVLGIRHVELGREVVFLACAEGDTLSQIQLEVRAGNVVVDRESIG